MTPKEREDAMNELMQIGAEIGRLPSQYQQLQAHMKLYSEFLEKLWNDGFEQGLAKGRKEKEINLSKRN